MQHINLQNIKYVYMLGIGGIGMSALARYFHAMGMQVAGYDKTETTLTQELISENIAVQYDDDVKKLPAFLSNDNHESVLVIYTPAMPSDLKLLNYLKLQQTLYKRSQVLGMIAANTSTVAVAGTHGKTTTSCMVTHLLKTKGIQCSAFLGGISKNYNTNFIAGSFNQTPHTVVVEADEFDRSFLTLFPKYAIITSTDADHLDIYNTADELLKSYNQFASQVAHDGKLVCRLGLKVNVPNMITYAINEPADARGYNIRIENHEYVFDYSYNGNNINNIRSGMPGRHNVENVVAAITIALLHGAGVDEIKQGVSSFTGVKRRFDYQIKSKDVVYIDDYAHHPSEIEAAIKSAKELYPGMHTTVIFQPHLYSRTRDFADGFASSLSLADTTILLPIYPARELPIANVNSEMIKNKMTGECELCEKSDLLEMLTSYKTALVMTLGAGDIDTFVAPVRQLLNKKINTHQ